MEKFSYEAKGYNRSEVNQFISEVIKETEGIITRVKKQNIEIENLKKELNHYKELEKTLSSTINKMEETKEKLTFVEVLVTKGARKDLGRPKSTPVENKLALMGFLNK